MALTVSDSYPLLFASQVDLAVQQTASKLRNLVTNVSFTGERQGYTFHNLRDATEVATNSRKQSTPDNDYSLERYFLVKTLHELVETGDERDEEFFANVMVQGSPQMQNFIAGINRAIDSKIITQALGNRLIGELGATTDALPAGQSIAIDYVPSGSAVTSGLTVDKIRQAGYLLDAQDVPEDGRVLVISAKAKQNLLATTEATSSDFMTVKALVSGMTDEFYGFKVVMSNLLPISSTTRSCLAFHKSGIKLAVDPVKAYMDTRFDKRHAPQVRVTANIGASRTENEKVVKILTSEA